MTAPTPIFLDIPIKNPARRAYWSTGEGRGTRTPRKNAAGADMDLAPGVGSPYHMSPTSPGVGG